VGFVPRRNPLALAALACAAVKGMEPVQAQQLPTATNDLDAAVVDDNLTRTWVVRAPRTAAAGARLAQETTLVDSLMSWVPFDLPQVAGSVGLPDGGRAMVYRQLPGRPLEPEALTPGPGLTAAVGRAIAAIHDLPERLVEDAGLPVYGAEEYRYRRLAEVDRAAGTGAVPARLLARWEQAVEEVGAWRFVPCFVHGDLAADSVLVDDDKVVAMLDWSQSRVADPADDLAWLVAGAPEPAVESVLEAYAGARREQPDAHLARRARLAAELAVARWLMHGVGTDDGDVVDDAARMLADLDAAVADTAW
jgi:macrolide phosphotransferase